MPTSANIALAISLSALTLLMLSACQQQNSVPTLVASEWQPGGGATVKRLHTRSYIYTGANTQAEHQLNFWTGFSLFRDPWVISPSSTTDRDGLGPLFNTRSCISCHLAGSRGKMSQAGLTRPSALVLRLGSTQDQNNAVDPHYGGQIQPRAINGNDGEAWLNLSYKTIQGQYSDGQRYQLQQPQYQLTQLSHGPLAEHIRPSPRYAPSIYGMGLLDAISEQDLLAQQDINDINQDGISAKYNRVTNVVTGQTQLGRFGLKAKQPNLKQQVAAAFRDDMGITNRLFNQESCTEVQSQCHKMANKGPVEIPDKLLDLVVEFSLFVGVPPARHLDAPQVMQGRQQFYQLGCQHCHTPSYTTDANYPIASLAGQKIWPYSDLALHDMGAGLADGINEFSANGNEWRTPPLWGIGLQQQILSEPRYLHDGRATTLEQAILWHGGEAQAAQQQFIQLSQSDRQALIDFIKAI